MLRQTIAKRMHATVKRVKEELRRRINQSIADQGRWLRSVVKGYFNYHAVPCNGHALKRFRHWIARVWCQTFRRRGQCRKLMWDHFYEHRETWLPHVRITHPYPDQRLVVNYPR